MRYVLDSCVAFKWVVPETDTDRAVRLRDAYRKAAHELLAPDIFPVEVAHALTRAERQGRIVVAQSGRLLTDVLSTAPALHPTFPLLTRACEISSSSVLASMTVFTWPLPSARAVHS